MMFQADLTRMLQRPKHVICPVHTRCSWHCWGHCKSKILYLFFSFLYTLSYVFYWRISLASSYQQQIVWLCSKQLFKIYDVHLLVYFCQWSQVLILFS